jgi:periplasmic protein TonB
MNEAVDRVLEEREALDKGLPASVVLSLIAHLLVLGGGAGVSWLLPKEPPLKVMSTFAVPLPRGGGGPAAPDPAPAPPAPVQSAAPEPAAPAVVPPPKVLKPPTEAPPKKALPPPEPRRTRARPTPTPPPRVAGRTASSQDTSRTGTGGAAGAAGTSSQTPGVGLMGPEGPGLPWGNDPNGDWYMAGVQRKIWLIWTRQIKTGHTQDIGVSLTILADGSLEDGSVRIAQSGGVSLLDLAAQRAVFSAAPFGPLPKNYGTNRITIQAVFRPTP